jgi:hypothetical protein
VSLQRLTFDTAEKPLGVVVDLDYRVKAVGAGRAFSIRDP